MLSAARPDISSLCTCTAVSEMLWSRDAHSRVLCVRAAAAAGGSRSNNPSAPKQRKPHRFRCADTLATSPLPSP